MLTRDSRAAQALFAVPDDVEDVAAAQFYVNPLTAIGLVEVLHWP